MPRLKKKTLTDKLLTLNPGETMYLDDTDPASTTQLNRSVHAAVYRSKDLIGLKFHTELWVAVRQSPVTAKRLIGITRIDEPSALEKQ